MGLIDALAGVDLPSALTDWRLVVGVHVDGQDVTSRFRPLLSSVSVTDGTGVESDTLEVVLALGHAGRARMEFPRRGAEVTLFLGTGLSATKMGIYVCDGCEASGPPDVMTLRATAAVLDGAGRRTAMQDARSRSWPAGTTLGEVVQRIADDHGMRPACAPSLAGVKLEHIDQLDESDLSLLTRLAKDNDAIFKPTGGALVLAKRGESKTASGAALPAVRLGRREITSWRVGCESREKTGAVVAVWRDLKSTKDKEVKVGSGDGPVTRLRHRFKTEAEAKRAAEAAKKRADRGEWSLGLELPGRADVQAEARLSVAGVYAEVDRREWLITSVSHSVDSSGWRTSVQAELPDADGEDGGAV